MDSTLPKKLISVRVENVSDTSFIESFCVPLLLATQNINGGWGFQPGAQSRVEPTCWALKALLLRRSTECNESTFRGLRFLTAAQLPDGSWSSTMEEKTGCWVTSLACWVLASTRDEKYLKAISSGLHWVCNDWPRDSNLWRRWLRKLSTANRNFKHNDSYRGWGWTPGTSSWVEPTAFALLALESQSEPELRETSEKRRKLGEALLYDRMCPGGGWNCGNPEVYGVAGDPLVIPTIWALLALRQYSERRENIQSLAWLESNIATIQGSGSYALARICLRSYERKWPSDASQLSDFHAKNESLRSTQVVAWMILSGSNSSTWLIPGIKAGANTAANEVAAVRVNR